MSKWSKKVLKLKWPFFVLTCRSKFTPYHSASMEQMTFWCWELTVCGMSSPIRKYPKQSPASWQTATQMTSTGTFVHHSAMAATSQNWTSSHPALFWRGWTMLFNFQLCRFQNIQTYWVEYCMNSLIRFDHLSCWKSLNLNHLSIFPG